MRNLVLGGFTGRITPVTARHNVVLDRPCVPSIRDLDEPVDLALLCVPAELTTATIAELGERGVRNAIVFSSGFAELGGDGGAREAELVELSARFGMAVVGPNCMGVVSARARVAATFSDVFPHEDLTAGPVAVVSQSGGMCAIVYKLYARYGIGVSYLVSSGNEACVDTADYLDHLAGDPDTRVVGAYLEQVRDGRRLLQAARRVLDAGQHVVILLGGRATSGARAARSHTGAIAAEPVVTADLLAAAGCTIVDDPAQFVAATELHLAGVRPRGGRLGIIANSGGTAVLTGDLAEQAALQVPELSSSTASALGKLMPSYATATNPVDVTAEVFFDAPRFARIVAAAGAEPNTDVLVVVSAFDEPFAEQVAAVLAPVLSRVQIPCVALWYAGSPAIAAHFRRCRVAYLDEPRIGLEALAAVQRATSSAVAAPGEPAPEPSASAVPTTEAQLKTQLAAAGFDVPVATLVTDPSEAHRLAGRVTFPVVAKAVSPDIVHKAAAGAMALDVRDVEALAAEVARLQARCAELGAHCAGVLVEETVAPGREFLLSAFRSGAYGPVLCLGVGGASVERSGVVRFACLPLDDTAVRHLFGGPATGGLGPDARAALERVVRQFAKWFCAPGTQLHDIELNPVRLVPDSKVVILDALGAKYAAAETRITEDAPQ